MDTDFSIGCATDGTLGLATLAVWNGTLATNKGRRYCQNLQVNALKE
ncbi:MULTISPECIES: hypothetical protein [unclassified Pseudomonas]